MPSTLPTCKFLRYWPSRAVNTRLSSQNLRSNGSNIKGTTPILLVPQENLPSIRKYMKERKLEITASVPNNKKEEAVQGQLEFIDSAIDVNTGTIRLWGTSANEKHILWPGQFVNVALILAQEPNMTVAPSQAVMSGQAGEYVYVVKTDNTVEVRTITVERTFNNSSVVEGLKAGETVVTDGQLRLVPGAKVQIKEASAKGG